MSEGMLTTERDFIRAASTGNKEAFGFIVKRYQTLICTIAFNVTGNISLSEDIAQDVFLIAWGKLRELRDPNQLCAWLCGIARNIVKDRTRKGQHDIIRQSVSLYSDNETPSASVPPGEQAISEEEQEILWQSIEKIPERYREPMILFYREQESIKKVAELLALSQDTIKQRLSRGRKMLKKQVAGFVEEALGRSGPKEAFALAVLAALPASSANGLASTGITVASTTGVLSAKATFWASLGAALSGLLIFLLTGGYLMLIGFVGFSLYLLLRHPTWYGGKKARFWMAVVPCFLLALLGGLTGKLYWSLLFVLLALGGLFALHPGCPEKARFWLSGPDRSDPLYLWKRWHWKVPPKYWKSALGGFLSLMLAFGALGIYVAYRTAPHIAWGFVIVAAILAMNFAVHSVRLVVRVWSCYRQQRKDGKKEVILCPPNCRS